MKSRVLIAVTLVLALESPFSVRADTNALKMINLTGGIANYDGSGVNIGQIESGGLPTNYVDFTTNVHLVPIEGETNYYSDHATEVTGVLISTGLVTMGVSTGSALYVVGPAATDDDSWLLATQAVGACKIINQSGGVPTVGSKVSSVAGTNYISYTYGNPNGFDSFSTAIDSLVSTKAVIYVKSAGNQGLAGTNTVTIPGDAYNVITVGSVSNLTAATTAIANSSSRGYLANGRSAVDLVAPGANVTLATFDTSTNIIATVARIYSNNLNSATVFPAGTLVPDLFPAPSGTPLNLVDTNSGTSYAAPLVSGVAARLVQYGSTLAAVNTNAATDPRTIKAVMLNSATKLATWQQGSGSGFLNGAFVSGVTNTVNQPLDPSQGAGLLNGNGSYLQLAAGRQGPTFTNNNFSANLGSVQPTGWDFNTVQLSLTNVYKLAAQASGAMVVTLDWYRDLGTAGGTNLVNGLADLTLQLYSSSNPQFNNASLVAQSISSVDNLQHLWFTNLPSAYYEFSVGYPNYNAAPGGGTNFNLVTYAAAWNFTAVPEPSSLLLVGLGITTLWWTLSCRRRP